MKDSILTWKRLLYRVKIEDIKGKTWEGKIDDCDDVGISIKILENDQEFIVLFPWTSIYKIEKC